MSYLRRKLFAVIALALLQLLPHPGFAASGSGSGGATAPAATANTGTALVIIDMQPVFVTRGGHADDPENARKTRELLDAQIAAIRAARRARMPIIFIEYQDEGTTNPELTRAAAGYASQTTVLKDTDGMFDSGNSHRQELVNLLNRLHVGNLVITGANGGACVEGSIIGALDAGYNVTAYSRGIADFNYEEFIYPYEGRYGHISPRNYCASCTLREVSTLSRAIPRPPSHTQGAQHKTTADGAACEPEHPMSEVRALCEEVGGALQGTETGD